MSILTRLTLHGLRRRAQPMHQLDIAGFEVMRASNSDSWFVVMIHTFHTCSAPVSPLRHRSYVYYSAGRWSGHSAVPQESRDSLHGIVPGAVRGAIISSAILLRGDEVIE